MRAEGIKTTGRTLIQSIYKSVLDTNIAIPKAEDMESAILNRHGLIK